MIYCSFITIELSVFALWEVLRYLLACELRHAETGCKIFVVIPIPTNPSFGMTPTSRMWIGGFSTFGFLNPWRLQVTNLQSVSPKQGLPGTHPPILDMTPTTIFATHVSYERILRYLQFTMSVICPNVSHTHTWWMIIYSAPKKKVSAPKQAK